MVCQRPAWDAIRAAQFVRRDALEPFALGLPGVPLLLSSVLASNTFGFRTAQEQWHTNNNNPQDHH